MHQEWNYKWDAVLVHQRQPSVKTTVLEYNFMVISVITKASSHQGYSQMLSGLTSSEISNKNISEKSCPESILVQIKFHINQLIPALVWREPILWSAYNKKRFRQTYF